MKVSNTLKSVLPAVVVGILTLGLAPTSAFAVSTATATMNVQASVVAFCSASVGTIDFGVYNVTAASTQSSILSITCSAGSTYTVTLDKGTNGTSVTARLMKNTLTTATLGYGLYTSASYIAANNFTGSTASSTGTGSAQQTTIYGQIPAGEYSTVGSYADALTATITY